MVRCIPVAGSFQSGGSRRLGWQKAARLGGKGEIVERKITPLQGALVQNTQRGHAVLDTARNQLLLVQRVNLITTNVFGTESFWRPAEIPSKLLDRADVTTDRIGRVVATPETVETSLLPAHMGRTLAPPRQRLSSDGQPGSNLDHFWIADTHRPTKNRVCGPPEGCSLLVPRAVPYNQRFCTLSGKVHGAPAL
jgi:hypothetical protein